MKFRRFMMRTLAMAHKEIMHILRDRQFLLFALGLPVLLLLIFGYAISFDVENISLVVVDQDKSSQSRKLIDRFTSSSVFTIVARRQNPDKVESLLRSGAAKTVLIIPHGFARKLKRGDKAQAQLLLDGSDNTSASVALSYANAVSLASSRDNLLEALGRFDIPIETRERILFNPELRSSTFLVPGLMVLILVMIAVVLTALTVAREYERGSMEQLFSTPVGRLEIILGKLAPYYLIGLVQVLLVVTLGVMLFNVPLRGSLLLLFGVSSLFMLAMLMQGLLVSVITRNQMLASMGAMVTTFMPALLLSGFIFPIENMPRFLQIVSMVVPARYFVSALRGIMLRGNGLGDIWSEVLALAAFFVVLLILAAARFRRRLA